MLPLFGALSDKTRTRFGRRTPYIIVGTIIAAISIIGLSIADDYQIANIADVDLDRPGASELLYNSDLTIQTPDGERFKLTDRFTLEEFSSIDIYKPDGKKNPDYTNYVVPARQAYALRTTQANKTPLIIFMVILFIILISMATFRSPAVALMPDVTIKPLRSKANAIINLMGAAGGIIILIAGMLFKTGAPENALMSYTKFLTLLAGIMLIALALFLWKVKEPQLVKEMQEESRRYGIPEEEIDPTKKASKNSYNAASKGAISKAEKAEKSNDDGLSREEKKSLRLLLASIVLWFFGYNAITSKYSIYAGSVLGMDYNLTLMLATASAILTFIPAGMISAKIGRKKSILMGITILTGSFLLGSFLRVGSPPFLMNLLFITAGIGWANINVNSLPMVVELAKKGNVGKFTGLYYTASMAAQTLTPILSGILMDTVGFTILFPYGALFVALSFTTMFFVKHGDNKPTDIKKLEAFDQMD